MLLFRLEGLRTILPHWRRRQSPPVCKRVVHYGDTSTRTVPQTRTVHVDTKLTRTETIINIFWTIFSTSEIQNYNFQSLLRFFSSDSQLYLWDSLDSCLPFLVHQLSWANSLSTDPYLHVVIHDCQIVLCLHCLILFTFDMMYIWNTSLDDTFIEDC